MKNWSRVPIKDVLEQSRSGHVIFDRMPATAELAERVQVVLDYLAQDESPSWERRSLGRALLRMLNGERP